MSQTGYFYNLYFQICCFKIQIFPFKKEVIFCSTSHLHRLCGKALTNYFFHKWKKQLGHNFITYESVDSNSEFRYNKWVKCRNFKRLMFCVCHIACHATWGMCGIVWWHINQSRILKAGNTHHDKCWWVELGISTT